MEVGSFYNQTKEVVRRRVASALRGNRQASIDDIVQDVFVIVYKTWPATRDSPNPSGYVINIANNLVLEYHRREQALIQRFAPIAEDEEEPADASAGAQLAAVEERIDAAKATIAHPRQSVDRLEELLSPLDNRPRQKEAVELHHAMGLSVSESAELLGANERTFRNNATLGLARLQEHYSSEPPEP